MSRTALRALILSDFHVETLASILGNDAAAPAVNATVAPAGSCVPLLADPGAEIWRNRPDAAVVWTSPEGVLPSFGRVLAAGEAEQELLEEVDAFAALLADAASRTGALFVPTWVAPLAGRGLGVLDLTHGAGVGRALLRANARLVERLAELEHAFVLDTARWLQELGPSATPPKGWYMAKAPFSPALFKKAADDIKTALAAQRGATKKLLVVDLDDTLWGGIVGELGWEGLRLGGHDHVGEAHADFQRALKALKSRGVLLAIASKNDEATALEALDRHPEMVLSRDDFSAWRINWRDKAANIEELVAELNLGLDAVVFIDDSAHERERVRSALPQVEVPEWPRDPALYRTSLNALRVFDTVTLSAEDRERAAMYEAERARNALRGRTGSVDDWLHSLEIRVTVERPGPSNAPRMLQLLNKTNQMNLSTRRLSARELDAWIAGESHELWLFRVADRLGDQGITGLVSVARESASRWRLVDALLSCRVMGRGVEDAMLKVAADHAIDEGAAELVADFRPTERNRPFLDFLERSPFACRGDNHWVLALDAPLAWPSHLRRIDAGPESPEAVGRERGAP